MAEKRPAIQMVRRGSFLAPYTPADGEALERYPVGKALSVRLSQARSVSHLRLYWTMLNLAADNLDQAVTPDALHEWIKLRCGVSVQIALRNGTVDTVPGSVAFDQMEQPEFTAFFERAATLIVEHLLPALGKPALVKEARLMLGAPV